MQPFPTFLRLWLFSIYFAVRSFLRCCEILNFFLNFKINLGFFPHLDFFLIPAFPKICLLSIFLPFIPKAFISAFLAYTTTSLIISSNNLRPAFRFLFFFPYFPLPVIISVHSVYSLLSMSYYLFKNLWLLLLISITWHIHIVEA